MAGKSRRPRLDDKALPPLLTAEVLRSEFIEECSRPENRKFIAGKFSPPLVCLRDRKASRRDKLDAWSKIVNRLGLDEKQRIEHSGALALSCSDVYVHPPEEPPK